MSNKFDEIINRRGTYCTQWDYCIDRFGTDDIIPYTISDSDFRMPETVITALHERIEHGILGYSRWNNGDFQVAICSWFDRQFATLIDPEHISYGPTLTYILKTLLTLPSLHQRTIIVHSPLYDGFTKLFHALGLKIIHIPLTTHSQTIEVFHEACRAHPQSIFVLCNPHNPTGQSFSEQQLIDYVTVCQKFDMFILSDEIHMDLVFTGMHQPIIKIATQLQYEHNVALLSSATKTFNFPALQTAYLILPDATLRAAYLHILRSVDCLSSPSILGVIATQVAYQTGALFVKEQKQYLFKNHQYIVSYIQKQKLPIFYSLPDATYFAWLNMENTPYPEDELKQRLIRHGVGIMPGSFYHETKNYLRLNVAAPLSKIKLAMEAITRSIQ